MSLQVWLPLNGDLYNQGLRGDLTATNTGATINNNGKIGKCYQFGTGASYIDIPNAALINCTTEASMCFWLNIITWNSNYATWMQAGNSGDSWAQQIFTFLRDSNTSKGIFIISNGSTSSTSSYKTMDLSLNTWYHIACVYKTGHCLIYVNGQLYQDYTTSIVPNFSSITGIRLGRGVGGNYQSNCQLNDVRIYDHALSPKEIEEIAKGLVLHYKLDDRFCEATTNLCANGTLSNSCYNGATRKYSYGTTTDIYKTTGVFQGRQSTKVYMGTAGNSAYPYVFFDYLHPAENTYKTLSFDYYPTSQTYLIFYTYDGSGTTTYSVNNGPITSGTSIPVELNKWNHIVFTILGTSSKTAGWGYVRIGSSAHTSTTTDYWLFANIQIEAKDHATPYTQSTRIPTTIYDSSGYSNNGIIVGSLATASPSPRYDVATVFDGVSRIDATTLGGEIKTLACWAKTTKNKSTSQQMVSDSASEMTISFYNGTIIGVFGTNRGTGSKCTLGSEYKENQWNHFVVVKTGTTGERDIYCNGVKLTPTSNDYWGAATGFFVGARNTSNGNPFYGEIVDVRAYATALTATQVAELYATSMSIDSSGNIYARELV